MKILQTFNDLDYEITDEQAEQIMHASTSAKSNGIWIDKDYIAFAAIKGITTLPEKKVEYPQLPEGNVFVRANVNARELMLKGFKRIKPNATMKDLEAFIKPKTYEVKYKTWEEAKAAGVI